MIFRPIGELCARITSGGTPSRAKPEYFTAPPEGHRWVKSKELLDCAIADTEERISDQGLQKSSAKYLPEMTVLVAMYGANVGQLGWLRHPATVNQAICGLVADPQKAYYRYLYYALLATREGLISKAQGAAQQNLNQDAIKSFAIPAPDLPTQRRIASILSAYDDLIENNTRRIAILEEMARRIYEEWFVRFRFPGHEQVKRVESELGLIPEGWAFKVKDALESSLGGDWGSDSPAGDDTEPVAVIRGTDFEDCQRGRESRCPLRYITKSSLTKRALRVGDIVIENSINAKSRTSGKPLFITAGLLKRLGGSVIAASFCKVFRLRSPELAPLLYLKMKRQFEEGEMAFFQNIAANGIANFQAGRYIENEAFWIPQELLGQRLVDTLTIILRGAANYADKNANLRATRDLLLPKLISGELAVCTLPEPEEAIAA